MAEPLLLNYQFFTDPDPIQVSTPQSEANGLINLLVAGPAVYCKQIMIAVPSSVFPVSPTAACNTAKWSITDQKQEIVGPDTSNFLTVFTFTCGSETDYQINYPLAFSISGPVAQTPASYQIKVGEISGTNTNTFTEKIGLFAFDMTGPQFYLRNFVATDPKVPLVPVTEFTNGAQIRLAWESNGSFFQVFKKNGTQVYSGTATTCTAEGVATDTGFFLIATFSPGIGSVDKFQGVSLTLYDALTITITNPDLTPNTVTSAADVKVGGNLSVAATANVTGQSNLGAVAVASTLNVGGATTLNGAVVNTALSATGTLQATGLSTLGALNVAGPLAAQGAVSMFGTAVTLQAGSFQANTDGLVLGFINAGGNDSTVHCLGWIWATCNGATAGATGGNTVYWMNSSADWGSCSSMQSFMLPVPANTGFQLNYQAGSSNDVAPNYYFYWVPMGVGQAPSAAALVVAGEHPEITTASAVNKGGSAPR